MEKPNSVQIEALALSEKSEALAMEADPDAGLSEQERRSKVCYVVPCPISFPHD